MKKYNVYVTISESGSMIVNAKTPEDAEEIALEHLNELEPYGDETYEVEVEEIEE